MYKTSYTEEFKWPEATGWGIKKWPKSRNLKFEDVRRNDPMFRNIETLSQLSQECVTPFKYLVQPKPILQTNPYQQFSMPELFKNDENTHLTRPRVYKCPEISLDDINDPDIRQKIIDYTYSTTWGLASKDASDKILKREIPNTVFESPDHVLFNKKSDGKEYEDCTEVSDDLMNIWDRSQMRAVGDPTLAFWQRFRKEIPLKISDKGVAHMKSPELTEKILNLARDKKLRLPYNLKPINYGGYMPEFPMEIEPQKKQLEFSDPMISTYQIANRWQEQ